MQHMIRELEAALASAVRHDEPLADYTTWKIGGPADLFVVPNTTAELAETVRILHRHQIPFLTIGRGSNMLVSDKGIRGVVIHLGSGFDNVRIEDSTVFAGGAVSLITLSVKTSRLGLTGFEFAAGIPGTVGGAVYMNAGAHGSDMSRILKEAEIVLETGEIVRLQKEQLQFAYRHSLLHEQTGIVTEAVLELQHGDREQIKTVMAANKERRLRTQPLSAACAGSTFRNPEGDYAARLIEAAGLKGYRVGGAEVSEQHANFIVNTGTATAGDVLALIAYMQQQVQEQFGISLTPEVLVVGER